MGRFKRTFSAPNIKIPKGWEISENNTTPESGVMNRRRFIKGAGTIAMFGAAWYMGCTSKTPSGSHEKIILNDVEKKIYPATQNNRYSLDRPMTQEMIAASYNNFYEFSSAKEDVRFHAQNLETGSWKVEVTGLVHKPRTFDIDDLLKTMPIEERLYRFRCVEAWAMAVPWTGFPLNRLLNLVEPMAKASHVRFTTFHMPFTAQGQLAFWYPWPYNEGLTLKEAMNDLTFMAVGIYGHPLPKQHGAPIRLVAPWKYGYKSAKSIVRIELLNEQPDTFWTTLQGLEYTFTANVNPKVPHPRWSQAKEKMIDTGEVRYTQLFNGYRDQVGHLYRQEFS